MFGNIYRCYGTYYVSNNGEDAYLYDVDPVEIGSTLGQVNNPPVTADFQSSWRRAVASRTTTTTAATTTTSARLKPVLLGLQAALSQGNATAALLGTESRRSTALLPPLPPRLPRAAR